MKRSFVLFSAIFLVFLMSGVGFAATWTRTGGIEYMVPHGGDTPDYWVDFDLPNWYDSNLVTSFEIRLYGDSDDGGSEPINVFLSFDEENGYTDYTEVASWNVDDGVSFTLKLDVVDNELFYDGNYVADFINVVFLSDFDNESDFSVGYGCHFRHLYTELEISQVPIPGAVWLLGSGLVGLAGLRRRFNKGYTNK